MMAKNTKSLATRYKAQFYPQFLGLSILSSRRDNFRSLRKAHGKKPYHVYMNNSLIFSFKNMG